MMEGLQHNGGPLKGTNSPAGNPRSTKKKKKKSIVSAVFERSKDHRSVVIASCWDHRSERERMCKGVDSIFDR